MTYIKKEVIGDCTLFLGDAKEIQLENKADLVLSDPPYLLTSGGGTNSHLGGCLSNGKYNNKGDIVACDITWQEIYSICYNNLKQNRQAYIMTNNRNMEECLYEAKNIGFKLHNILVWDKKTVTPNRFYMNGVEFGVFLYKGKARYIKDMNLSNLFAVPNKKGSGHPTEKPIELMECWIKQSTDINNIVFDPFMGSGSTGVACAKLSREFIGIEIEEKYFNIACKRIEEAYKQPSFLGV